MPGDVRDYLNGLLNSIENDVLNVLRYHHNINRQTSDHLKRGGFHSVPRQVFCYLDHLSSLRYEHEGGSETDRAIKIIDSYFARLNPLYRTRSQIIYRMWRQGTVHEYDPKVFVGIEGVGGIVYELGWVTSDDSDDESKRWHLQCVKKAADPKSCGIVINLFQLGDDLVRVVQTVMAEVRDNETLCHLLQTNFDRISQRVPLRDVALLAQAEEAVADCRGTIDAHGNIIQKILVSKIGNG